MMGVLGRLSYPTDISRWYNTNLSDDIQSIRYIFIRYCFSLNSSQSLSILSNCIHENSSSTSTAALFMQYYLNLASKAGLLNMIDFPSILLFPFTPQIYILDTIGYRKIPLAFLMMSYKIARCPPREYPWSLWIWSNLGYPQYITDSVGFLTTADNGEE